jgi:hypothetical protein
MFLLFQVTNSQYDLVSLFGSAQNLTTVQLVFTLAEAKIGCLVYANGWSGGTVVTITLLFTFIMFF